MPRNATNALNDVTAGFPGAVYAPREIKSGSRWHIDAYTGLQESGTVPGIGAPQPYTVELNQGIRQNGALTIVCGVDTLAAIPYVLTPAADEVAVDYDLGWLRFPSGRAAQAWSVTYDGAGTRLNPDLLNTLQKELAAVQAAVQAGGHAQNTDTGTNAATWTAQGNVVVTGTSAFSNDVGVVGSIEVTGNVTAGANVSALEFTGDGANLTNLNANTLSSGTVPDSRLSSNVPLKNAANTFTAAQTVSSLAINGTGKSGVATILETSTSVNITGIWAATAVIVISLKGADNTNNLGAYVTVTAANAATITIPSFTAAAADQDINWRVID